MWSLCKGCRSEVTTLSTCACGWGGRGGTSSALEEEQSKGGVTATKQKSQEHVLGWRETGAHSLFKKPLQSANGVTKGRRRGSAIVLKPRRGFIPVGLQQPPACKLLAVLVLTASCLSGYMT